MESVLFYQLKHIFVKYLLIYFTIFLNGKHLSD